MLKDHYKTDSVDVIDIAKLCNLNFNRGNIVKYICRAGKKDSELDDLLKAQDYIKRELEFINKQLNKD